MENRRLSNLQNIRERHNSRIFIPHRANERLHHHTRKTYPNVRLLAAALNAYQFFRLGVRPKFVTVADKMLTIASHTSSFGYGFKHRFIPVPGQKYLAQLATR